MLPFVGRDTEVATLTECWERARAGEAQLVWVTGEAGVGKTRLLDELVTRVRGPGDVVMRGRSWDLGDAPAFWHWIQVFGSYLDDVRLAALAAGTSPSIVQLMPRLRGLLPEPPAPDRLPSPGSTGQTGRLDLFLAVATVLRRLAAEQPLLLALDDLEHADAASLHLLRFLVRSRGAGRLMLVGLHRSGLPPGSAVGELLAGLAREPGIVRLDLGGLDPGDIARLMSAMTGAPTSPAVAGALHGRTGGNPLFASEFVRLLTTRPGQAAEAIASAPPPAGVRAVIEQRLVSLPPRCRELLEVAAVVGRDFDLGTLAAATGSLPEGMLEALTPALDTNVLGPVPGHRLRFTFLHPLIRDCLHDGLAAPVRARLHGLVAEALCRQHPEALDEHAPEIASHFAAAAQGGPAPLAADFYRRAAGRATRVGAVDEAIRLLGQALALCPAEGALRCETLIDLGEAQARTGDLEGAVGRFVAAAEEAQRSSSPGLLARAALAVGGRFVWARPDRADETRLLHAALAALPPDEIPFRVRLLARLSGSSRDRAGAADRLARCRAAVELARQGGVPDDLAYALDALGVAELGAGAPPAQVLQTVAELEQTALAAGNAERLIEARARRAVGCLDLGDVARAEEEAMAALQLADRLGQTPHRWYATVAATAVALARGDLARARTLATEGHQLGALTGRPEALFVHLMQSHAVLREAGLLDEAERLLEGAPALAEVFPPLQVVGAHLAAQRGRDQEARAFLERHLPEAFAGLDDCLHWRYQLALLVELVERLAYRPAVPVLERLLDEGPSANLVSPIIASAGAVARYRGLLAATDERWRDAERLLEQAVRENRTAGARLQALRSELDLARLHLRRPGGREEGLALLEEVARTAAALGAAGIAAEAAAVDPAATAPAPSGPGLPAIFRREGEYWTIGLAGSSVRLRDARGLQYLAQLLAEPGRELAAMALAGGSAAAVEELAEPGLGAEGDLGPLLDAQARAELRQRLSRLQREIEEAGPDDPRVARARREAEAIEAELRAAVGLGGRERRIGDPADRARQSVTKAIKAAIARIGDEHEELGRHLRAQVHTGFFCGYEVDRQRPFDWRVTT
jgi:tetratricopeptide (TPR) repeat protein